MSQIFQGYMCSSDSGGTLKCQIFILFNDDLNGFAPQLKQKSILKSTLRLYEIIGTVLLVI